MQQIVFDFERQECAPGPQHAKSFPKSVLLRVSRAQMVQHQNGDDGRKRALRERKRGSISLHDRVSIF